MKYPPKFLSITACWLAFASVHPLPVRAQPPVVRILPLSDAFEAGLSNGLFRVHRTGVTTAALAVTYQIRGTARNGDDYTRLPGSLTIPSGQESATIAVQALDDALEEPPERIELTLTTSASPFTFVVLPDTQVYVRYNALDFFASQTRWIRANKDSRNIVFVFHEGDCTDLNTEYEWTRFKDVMNDLDGVVPYALVPGNHDGMDSPPFDTALMNQYYPVTALANQPGFGGLFESNKIDNSYYTFRAGGLDWLVLALEFGPRDEVLAWASQVVSNLPNHKAILLTHAHVYTDDTLYGVGFGQAWAPTAYGRPNNGIDVWNKLIRHHANFALAFNGHVLNDGAGRVVMTGDHGNKVYQMLANYQTLPNGGNSFLRTVEFSPAEDKFAVRTYAPYTDAYFVHPKHEFEYTNLNWFSATNAAYEVDPAMATASIGLADNDTDSIPPSIARASALGVPPEIIVLFDEPIHRADAEDPANFSLSHGALVLGASLDADQQTLRLYSSQLSTGLTYTLTVNTLFDLARAPNEIAPNSQCQFLYQPLLMLEGFDDLRMPHWVVVDQGDRDRPSNWYVRNSRLEQAGNIYGPNALSVDNRLGTMAYWNKPLASTWTNYTFAATFISSDDDGVGLLFRFQNPSNYYKLEFDRQHSFRKLYRMNHGIETLLLSDSPGFQQGVPTRLQVQVSGPSITAWMDGTNIFRGLFFDSNPLSSGTVGLYCWGNSGVAFDDVVVTAGELPPPDSLLNTNSFIPASVSTLVPIDGVWRFWPFDDAPDTRWSDPSYDDSFWPGPNRAIFAHEPDPIPDPRNTELDIGPIAYYFRTQFVFPVRTNDVELRLRALIDDGAVIYLNGAEVWRPGMAPGPVLQSTLAQRDVGNAEYDGPFDFPVTNLITGTNVLAAEVHQSTPFSEDVVFGVELEALIPLALPVTIHSPRILPNGNLRVSFQAQGNRVYTLESSTNLVDWTPLATQTNQTGLPTIFQVPIHNEPSRFFRALTQQ